MTISSNKGAQISARRSGRIAKREHRASAVNRAATQINVPNLAHALSQLRLELDNEEQEEWLGGVSVECISDPEEEEEESRMADGIDMDNNNDSEEDSAMDVDKVVDRPPRSLMAAIRMQMQEFNCSSPSSSRATSVRSNDTDSLPAKSREKKTRVRRTIAEKLLVVNAVFDKRLSYAAVGELFGMRTSTVSDIVKQYSRGKLNADTTSGRVPTNAGRPQKITDEGHAYIAEFVALYNSATLQQIQTAYLTKFGIQLGITTIYDHLRKQCQMSLKRAVMYPEKRNAEETKEKRATYVKEWITSGILDYEKNCVFIDEASYNLSMGRNYAWSRVGEPARVMVKKMRTKSRTLIAAISYAGLCGASIKEGKGGTKSTDFVAFLEEVMDDLDRNGRKGWYLVCDNAAIHKTKIVCEAVESRGYHIVYLPPYSPFLNPIEEFFSKVKAIFRRVAVGLDPENAPMLHDRLTQAIAEVRAEDYAGWARHATTFFTPCLEREDML